MWLRCSAVFSDGITARENYDSFCICCSGPYVKERFVCNATFLEPI